ncbi:sarcosine oxidase subunit gamma [Methylobacterium brachiatum]|jgi:sarcosine oxidase subunit gamma|uniref:sarcosine oxidase subunit gamma n=1 Tax=Methylobacterium brachiatum TaxID=269660 RepID=UPI00244BE52F|nr:sarcosine oxidase subunit gamma family protein [Methylobacterium brachiatum]MDH2312393.1 sarcosine oxidase subunit gamma family protein [Methylobacterium brachiatum]
MIQERNTLTGRSIPVVADRLSVSEAPDCARLALRVHPDDRAAIVAAAGIALPDRIGGVEATTSCLALCLGPDEWYLLLSDEQAAALKERMKAAIAPFSLVDVGHREVGIDVKGSAATLALSSICALDLEGMGAGSATRTILDKAQAVLVKRSDTHYRIEVWQSFSEHVWTLLDVVSREIASGV